MGGEYLGIVQAKGFDEGGLRSAQTNTQIEKLARDVIGSGDSKAGSLKNVEEVALVGSFRNVALKVYGAVVDWGEEA